MLQSKLKKIIESECKNVAIFVDFDNIYYGLSEYGINLESERYDIFYILNHLYDFDKIRQFNAFADFEQIKIPMKHLQTRRVSVNNVFGNSFYEKNRKNASDIELSISAMETYYTNKKIDTFVFVTSDSDMIPIMHKLLLNGKKVHLYSVKENSSEYITNFCTLSVDLIEFLDIDINRKNPEFWTNMIRGIFKEFYENPNYSNKLLTNKWLIERIQNKNHMSIQASSKLIQSMIDLDIIECTENNQFYGYKLK